MADAVQASGPGPGDLLVRRGRSWESAKRLAVQAAAAEKAGATQNGFQFGHGVSVTSAHANRLLARDPDDAVSATRKNLEEAGFEVRHTPTEKDPDHHTVQLPRPVTDEIAVRFNDVFGRRKS